MKTHVTALAVALALGATAPGLPASTPFSMTPIGTVKTGPLRGEDPRVAEINAYDASGKRVYLVNPQAGVLDVLDVSQPTTPVRDESVDIVAVCQAARPSCPVLPGSEPNSVAINGHIMVVAVANAVRTDPGHAVFFWLRGSAAPLFLAAVEAGALPDMVTFSDLGRYVIVANEGEPSQDYTIDPPGSVTIIDLWWPFGPRAVRQVGFEKFDTPAWRAALIKEGVRIFGPNARVSQDLEPEYIAVEGNTAYVTLQENNAIAMIDIAAGKVEKIVPMGLKNHMAPGNALDPSDQDGGINIRNWPISGLYQPDAIHAFRDKFFRPFLIMANEGDAREYSAYVEAVRLGSSSYVLDPIAFPAATATALKANAALGRLNVSTASGDTDGDGDFDRIETFGARSVSIRDAQGRLVWDSGDLFERLSAQYDGTRTVFNTTNTANSRENRSDDKGIEPESVVVGDVKGKTYAFVGLERDSGIVVLDLSKPAAPAFVTYVTNRKLPRNATTGAFLPCTDASTNDCGDLGPEGLSFVSARQSPTGKALLIVTNEVSSTTTLWQID